MLGGKVGDLIIHDRVVEVLVVFLLVVAFGESGNVVLHFGFAQLAGCPRRRATNIPERNFGRSRVALIVVLAFNADAIAPMLRAKLSTLWGLIGLGLAMPAISKVITKVSKTLM